MKTCCLCWCCYCYWSKFDSTLAPLAENLIAPDQRSRVTFDAFFVNDLLLEMVADLRWQWDLAENRAFHYGAGLLTSGIGGDGLPHVPGALIEVVHPDDRDRVEANAVAWLEGRTAHYREEFRIRNDYDASGAQWRSVSGMSRSAFGRPWRCRARSRAAATARRARPCSSGAGPGERGVVPAGLKGALSAATGTAGTGTCRSMRSSSGPEMRAR